MLPKIAPLTAALTLAMLAGAATLRAAEPPSPIAAPDSDIMLAARVTAALAADPELAGLNLTVDVSNRVAVVGGPVPSEDVLPKLRAALAKVPGLTESKVSGWVPSGGDPLARRVGEKLAAPAPPVVNADKRPPADVVTGLPPLILPVRADALPPTQLVPPLLLAERPAPAPPPAAPPAEVPAAPKVAGPNSVRVERYAVAEPASLGLQAPVAASASDAATQRVTALRASSARFGKLVVTAKGSGFVVTGKAATRDDVWDFVDLVKVVPGVSKVTLGKVETRD